MRLTPPEFDGFADVVMRFVYAAESLLQGELSHPFNIGSEALRDSAARHDYPGTQSKQTLLTLATQQVAVGVDQCGLLRGVAALLRTDLVVLAPFPLARTSAVIAAKAWFILTGGSRDERLRRYLNEELAALYGIPFASDDKDALTFRADSTADYLAVGAMAGLAPVYGKNPRPWDAPFLASEGCAKTGLPPSETQLVRELFRAAGLEDDQLAGLPYALLSAATHGRFRHAGLVGYAPAGPSVGDVSTAAMHVTLGVTAQSTMYAAVACRTYLCALARYTGVSEVVVLDRLREPVAEWLAMSQSAEPI